MPTLRAVPAALATVLLVAGGSSPCRSQEPSAPAAGGATSLLGVSLGLNELHLRDEYIAPSTQRGRLGSLAAAYELRLSKTTHTLDFGWSTGGLDADGGQPAAKATAHVGYVSYAMTRSIRKTRVAGRKLHFALGGDVSTFVSYETVGVPANTNWYGADESWYWSHALDLQLLGEYELSAARSLSVRLATPVARLVSRPDNGHFYSPRNRAVQHESVLDAAKGGQAELPWGNPAARCDIEYRQRLGARLTLRASYAFRFFSSRTPLAMRAYTNNLLVGLLWRP